MRYRHRVKVGDALESPLDTYTVDAQIGAGGFGITWRARRGSDGRAVVLKALRLERLEDWKALELFEREAAVLKSLEHPGIPAFFELFATTDGSADRDLILVQALVEGENLAADAMRIFEPPELERLLKELLEILAYLHELSPPVVHRDINPKNIVLAERAYLVDFGAIQHTLQSKTIGGSTSVGTFGYVPIEQAMGRARPASDLYALGVTFVALMTGRTGDWPLVEATSKIDLDALGLLPQSQTSPERAAVCRVVDRMIEPLVSERIASAREALQGLAGIEMTLGTEGRALEQRAGGKSWHRPLFTLALGGSLGSALVLYPLGFDKFSETDLIVLSPLWVLSAAFGFFGLLSKRSQSPIKAAMLGALLTGLGLAGFFGACWSYL